MQKDENERLVSEIRSLFKRAKIKELHKSSCELIEKKFDKLVDAYSAQHKKDQKTIKNQAYVIKQIDKRTVNVNASSIKKDKMLAQQSKMAAMGEMMDAVAHQWKQPLNSLSMLTDMLKDDFHNGLVDAEYIEDMTQTTHLQISHMVNTLSEFRSFFRPSKSSADFSLQECLESVQILMKDELLKNNINLTLTTKNVIVLYGQINEFKHLFLNLLSNSIDAYNEKEISHREICITTYIDNGNKFIDFIDNAGGIPQHIIADIFKPNITTKVDGKGTGIGLYMSSQIVQKHHGSIEVSNTQDGALFRVTIKN